MAERPAICRAAPIMSASCVAGGKLYAIGGFVEQNRKPDNLCFVLEGEAWRAIAPLPKAAARDRLRRASTALCTAIGGAVGDTFADKKSVDWHLVYDPRIDQWATRAPMPTGRDHTGTLTVNGLIHVIGGRVEFVPHQFQPASCL